VIPLIYEQISKQSSVSLKKSNAGLLKPKKEIKVRQHKIILEDEKAQCLLNSNLLDSHSDLTIKGGGAF